MKYLSTEWFEAANELLADQTSGEELIIETKVDAETPISFNLELGTPCKLDPKLETSAAVTIQYSYETAVAIAKGETNIREAILSGDIELSGETIKLAETSKDLARVAQLLSPLSKQTQY